MSTPVSFVQSQAIACPACIWITFFLAHGTSAAMAFKIRKERDFARIGAMLDLSWSTIVLMLFVFIYMPHSTKHATYNCAVWLDCRI
ncbi:MAG TPA: hypothetical protein VJ022_01200 [Anaerolineales bacterium]|nr:hypothetical protein [Anaerolineales bacterium]